MFQQMNPQQRQAANLAGVALVSTKLAKGILAANATLTAAGIPGALLIWGTIKPTDKFEETTIRDIVGKLIKYGSVSEKQMAFVARLMGDIAKRPEREAVKAAEHAMAAPVPAFTGRVRVEGTVLARKQTFGAYGEVVKVLVQHADGWKMWGTNPCPCQKGDRIAFEAAFEVSKDDPKFAFFSRPKKGEVIAAAAAEQVAA